MKLIEDGNIGLDREIKIQMTLKELLILQSALSQSENETLKSHIAQHFDYAGLKDYDIETVFDSVDGILRKHGIHYHF